MNTKTERRVALRAPKQGNGANPQGRQTALALEMQWNTLLGQQDLLRDEIKRGKESLEQAQTELAESRSRLEEWPSYERRCGENSLPCLTELVSGNRRIERFLTGWLNRRLAQLVEVEQTIDRFARQHGLEQSR